MPNRVRPRSADTDASMAQQQAELRKWFTGVEARGTPVRGERKLRLLSPHGVLPITGVIQQGGATEHPEFVILASPALWWLPGLRDLLTWCRIACVSVDRFTASSCDRAAP